MSLILILINSSKIVSELSRKSDKNYVFNCLIIFFFYKTESYMGGVAFISMFTPFVLLRTPHKIATSRFYFDPSTLSLRLRQILSSGPPGLPYKNKYVVFYWRARPNLWTRNNKIWPRNQSSHSGKNSKYICWSLICFCLFRCQFCCAKRP